MIILPPQLMILGDVLYRRNQKVKYSSVNLKVEIVFASPLDLLATN